MRLKSWQNMWLLLAPATDDGGDDEETLREAGFQRLADRYKEDATGLAKDLYRENYQARRKAADLTKQLEEAKKQIPSEGSLVLTSEQALQWAAYQSLGTPEVVRGIVEEKGQLQGKLDSMAREAVLRDAASVAGFHYDVLLDADVLAEKRDGKKLTYEVRTVDRDGEKVKAAFVKDGDVETPLSEYAQTNWAKLLPSLTANEQGNGGQGGTAYPTQHQGSGGGNRPSTPIQQTKDTLSKQYPSRAKAQ